MNYLKRNAIPLVVGLVAIVGILSSTGAVVRHFATDVRGLRASSTFRLDGGATLGVQVDNNLTVTSITSDSAAQKAGVQPQDQITAVAGHQVSTFDDLRAQLAAVTPNTDYALSVTRGGKPVELTAHKGAASGPGIPLPGAPRGAQPTPAAPGASPTPSTPPSPRGGVQGPRIGVLAEVATGGLRVGGVTPGSPAEAAGLKTDDLITAANNKPTATVEDLQGIVADAGFGGTVTLTVTRDGKPTTVTVKLAPRTTPRGPSA